MIKLFFLGRPYIEVNGQEIQLRRRKNLALLAYLALADEPRRREELTALLWPELDTYHAQTALRRDLWVLKNSVKSIDLIATRDSVGLRQGTQYWCDISAFHGFLAQERCQIGAITAEDYAETAPLIAAVQLYRDDFLRGFSLTDSPAFDEWQVNQAEALRHEMITALNKLVAIYAEGAQPELAITYAQRLIELDAFHEPAHYQLMALYAKAGRYGAALQQFERYTRLLSEQLNLPPSEEMAALHASIQARLDQSPVVLVHDSEKDVQFVSSGDSTDEVPITPRSAEATDGQEQFVRRQAPLKLPTPATPFVGRERDRSLLIEHLSSPQRRLMTVLGPGGMGKSRLAIAVAERLHGSYPDGIFFANLAPLRHAHFLAAALLEALDIRRETDRTPEETLIAHLRERRLLLILDNYEHLLEGTPFLQRLLAATESVQLLITSRTRLNIPQEWVFPLAGMTHERSAGDNQRATPGSDGNGDGTGDGKPAEEVGALDAIILFQQCAQRVQPAMHWRAQEAAAAAEICRLVDGIPLAIELAAAWLPVMTATAIAANLRQSLDLLATTEEIVTERHRSMHSTLEYSWQLAGPAEQMVLMRLAIFHGGFLPPIAQAIADADPAMLRILTDKSWLHRTHSGRVAMHEIIRQFCAERLTTGSPEATRIHARHARFYANFMQERTNELRDQRQVAAVQAVADELDNIRAAWEHALASDDSDVLDDLLDGYYYVGLIRNWHQEQVELFTATLTQLNAMDQGGHTQRLPPQRSNGAAEQSALQLIWLRARLHTRLAHIQTTLGQFDEANEHCTASLALLDGAQPTTAQATMWTEILWRQERALLYAIQSHVLHNFSLVDAAMATVAETGSLLKTLPTGLLSDITLLLITKIEAIVRFATNERQAALTLLVESAAQLRKRGELWLRAQILDQLIFQLRVCNELALSEHYATEWLTLCRTLGDQRGVAFCLLTFGYNAIFCDTPDLTMAQRYFDEMAEVSEQLGHPLVHLYRCEGLAQLAYFQGEWGAARRYLAEAQAIAEMSKNKEDAAFVHIWFGEIALAEDHLGEAQRHFALLLTSAGERNVVGEILLGLEGLAKVCLRRGAIVEALPILYLIQSHPSTWEFARKRVNRIIEGLQAKLPNEHRSKNATEDAALTFAEAVAWAKQQTTEAIT